MVGLNKNTYASSPIKQAYNNRTNPINPFDYSLQISQCVDLINSILTCFKENEFKQLFLEEFTENNKLANKTSRNLCLAEFWMEMLSIYIRLRRKGLDLEPAPVNFSKETDPKLFNRNLGYDSPSRQKTLIRKTNSDLKYSPSRFADVSTHRFQIFDEAKHIQNTIRDTLYRTDEDPLRTVELNFSTDRDHQDYPPPVYNN